MINQQPISAKIYQDLYEELELEASLGIGKKNWIINRALRFYFDYIDLTRGAAAMKQDVQKTAEYEEFFKRWFLIPDHKRNHQV